MRHCVRHPTHSGCLPPGLLCTLQIPTGCLPTACLLHSPASHSRPHMCTPSSATFLQNPTDFLYTNKLSLHSHFLQFTAGHLPLCHIPAFSLPPHACPCYLHSLTCWHPFLPLVIASPLQLLLDAHYHCSLPLFAVPTTPEHRQGLWPLPLNDYRSRSTAAHYTLCAVHYLRAAFPHTSPCATATGTTPTKVTYCRAHYTRNKGIPYHTLCRWLNSRILPLLEPDFGNTDMPFSFAGCT